jgi:hypothetical protein
MHKTLDCAKCGKPFPLWASVTRQRGERRDVCFDCLYPEGVRIRPRNVYQDSTSRPELAVAISRAPGSPTLSDRPPAELAELVRPVTDLGLPARVVHYCLKPLGIVYVGELVQLAEEDLMRRRLLGVHSLKAVVDALSVRGLSLGTAIPGWSRTEARRLTKSLGVELCPLSDRPPAELVQLVRPVTDLGLPVRVTHYCLRPLGVDFVGELVQLTEADLMLCPLYGVRSLKATVDALSMRGLSLGLRIPGWSRASARSLAQKLGAELNQVRNREARERAGIAADCPVSDTVEDDIATLLAFVEPERTRQMLAERNGWTGRPAATLGEIGRRYGLTRERVRQVTDGAWVGGQGHGVHAAVIWRAVEEVYARCPAPAKEVETALEALKSAAELAGTGARWSVLNLTSGERVVTATGTEGLCSEIVAKAKRDVRRHGVSTLANVSSLVAWPTSETDASRERFVEVVLRSLRDYVPLETSTGWFWLAAAKRTHLLRTVRKVVACAGLVSVDELRRAVQRDHRLSGFVPPRRVLLALCECLNEFDVVDDTVRATPCLTESKPGKRTAESVIVDILREKGPLMATSELRAECGLRGVNGPSFMTCLCYSPLVLRVAPCTYTCVGAPVQPGAATAVAGRRSRHTKVVLDFGMTPGGRTWLALRITRSIMQTGVIGIPSAIRKFLGGQYALHSEDDSGVGTIVANGVSAWGLSPFFRRRGGEVGDVLVLEFDHDARKCKLAIGGQELIDSYR